MRQYNKTTCPLCGKDVPKLSSIEFDTLWMAIRYAMGRSSIASQSLPGEIIKAYFYRLTEDQKEGIVEDLERQQKDEDLSDEWLKFLKALNQKEHLRIKDVEGNEHECFYFYEKCVPVKGYIEHPSLLTYIPEENIDQIL